MSSAKITLFSFANWMHQNNDDLFSNLSVPDGIEKNTLIDNILLRGGEFEVVYSDPNFMQYAIGSWSRKWYRTMQKWIDALSIDYAPLENYDRNEYWKDITDRDTGTSGASGSENIRTHADTDTKTFNNTDVRTNDNTDQRTHDYVDQSLVNSTINDEIDEDDTKETKVSAFDSSDYQPSQYEEASHDGDNTRTEDSTNTQTHAGTITDDHTGTITDDHTGTITDGHTGKISDGFDESHVEDGYEDVDFEHQGRIHGNIGVTTSQQMLQAELDIAEWNIYEHITDLFLNEFVIPIYT